MRTFAERGVRWWVIGILLAATYFLFYDLAADSLWGDEIFTASFAALPAGELIAWTAGDIHPPLYYLLAGLPSHSQWLWPAGLPSPLTDWLWRWPSAAAAVLAVAATYRLGRETLGSRVGMLAAALLAVAPVAVKYGQEARMHALFMGLSALSTLLLVLAWRRGRRRYWLAYAVATALNLYTMYFAFLVVGAQAAWVAVRALTPGANRRSAGRWLAAILLACLAYGPWWPVLFGIVRRRAAIGAVEGGVGPPLVFWGKVVTALGGGDPWAAWLFFGLYLAGLGLAARQRRWSLLALGVAWVGLPALLPLLAGDPRALHLRYAFVLPVFLLFVAATVLALGRRLAALTRTEVRWGQLYAAWLAVTVSLLGVVTVFAQTKPDWRGAAAYLGRKAARGDVIVTGPLWDDGRFLAYYYRGPAELTTPAGLAAALPGRAESLRAAGGRVWLVNRFTPELGEALRPVELAGVTVSEPALAVYEPEILQGAMIEVCRQAVAAAYPWAEAMEAGGVLNPDPRTSQAAAYQCLGETLLAAGQVDQAVAAYQAMVEAFPGSASGYLSLAELHEARGDLAAALAAYEQAVATNPTWRGPLADQAVDLAGRGEVEAALAIYHRLTTGR